MTTFERFLVPYDFSEHSKSALSLAVDLARRTGAEIQVLHIVVPIVLTVPAVGPAPIPPVGVPVDLPHDAELALARVVAPLNESGLHAKTAVIESNSIAEAIRRHAVKTDAGLIVMGTHGRTALARMLLGSVTERVVRQAPCPVLLTAAAASAPAAQ
jgi:nucleotide-binding universal stress UspA family protein